jgi:hypothetical protein
MLACLPDIETVCSQSVYALEQQITLGIVFWIWPCQLIPLEREHQIPLEIWIASSQLELDQFAVLV